ncbi:hypothetical protein BX666DRAFT_308211 [Dichotomocladium elegans]|nr:hypothetical protein BX666DRAFT_308211 [Dichotomocladium elegans]
MLCNRAPVSSLVPHLLKFRLAGSEIDEQFSIHGPLALFAVASVSQGRNLTLQRCSSVVGSYNSSYSHSGLGLWALLFFFLFPHSAFREGIWHCSDATLLVPFRPWSVGPSLFFPLLAFRRCYSIVGKESGIAVNLLCWYHSGLGLWALLSFLFFPFLLFAVAIAS